MIVCHYLKDSIINLFIGKGWIKAHQNINKIDKKLIIYQRLFQKPPFFNNLINLFILQDKGRAIK